MASGLTRRNTTCGSIPRPHHHFYIQMSKGIILAGGNGTRLRPLTLVTNKHLLPVYTKPMIVYPLETLKTLGVTDILIVSGGEHIGGFAEFLGDGSEYGVNLTYRVQKDAGGIAEAIGLARDFAQGKSITVILGDNIFQNELIPKVDVDQDKAYLYTKKVKDPQRFGVVSKSEVGREGKETIVEKPVNHVGDQAVVGLYVYPSDVFDVVATLKPSARGELEVTDISNHYLREGRAVITEMSGFWSDAGTFDSLLKASLWASKAK